MKRYITVLAVILVLTEQLPAQTEPAAGKWKTWFIPSVAPLRLPPPPPIKEETSLIISAQQNLDAAGRQQILFWNAGAPGYRWQEIINKLWMNDTSRFGALANMLLGTSIYDATVAAWDTKFHYNRPRPYAADKRIRALVPKPESPAWPCEYSVAAGAAATIISHFYPAMADSVNRLARQCLASRIAAGVSYPSDTRAGFDLGRKVAEQEIERTKDYIHRLPWNGRLPTGPGAWKGRQPMFPTAGLSKTAVLDSSSQFRPAPPPDFAKEMAELKNFKQTFRSQANAFMFASQPVWEDLLAKKLFEYNLHLNAPRAARIYALTAVTTYDVFLACWDAKYAYWGIRPDQYDTTYHPLIPTPPFPGYPSGHAAMSGMMAGLLGYFFPAEKAFFDKKAKDGAESRFQAGIHFRSDNEAGLELGRKVAAAVIKKAGSDGVDDRTMTARQ